jgi:chromosome partitioning protein
MEKQSEHKTRVIAVGNQKGGVGKTTNTAHIAAALGQIGRKVLVWDLDVNYGLTSHFGVPPQAYSGTFHVLTRDRDPEDVILTNEDPDIQLPEGVHLIPSSRELEKLETVLRGDDPFFTPREVLIAPLSKLRGKYDYIFLDTAPNTNVVATLAAYIVADYFIISTLPEKLALEGLKNALKDIGQAQRSDRNPNLKLLGVVVSGLDKRIRKAREYDEAIKQSFTAIGQESRKFQTSISRAAVIPRAQDQGKTVFQTEPQHEVIKQFLDVAKELEERIVSFEQGELPQQSELSEEQVANG